MNKSELIEIVAKDAELTKAAATQAVEATFNAIMTAVAAGETAQFVGFGTFKSSKRAARTGKNPKTGAELQIPASTVAKFAPGSAFKAKVNV